MKTEITVMVEFPQCGYNVDMSWSCNIMLIINLIYYITFRLTWNHVTTQKIYFLEHTQESMSRAKESLCKETHSKTNQFTDAKIRRLCIVYRIIS